MALSYSFRGILEDQEGKQHLYYEKQVGEIGFMSTIGGNKIDRYMMSTDMYIDTMERPLYQCDLVKIEGMEGTYIIEFDKSKFGFIAQKLDSQEWFYLHSVFEKITECVGTFYDDKTETVINEKYVTL